MFRSEFSAPQVSEVHDESVATTLKVIMDVLKSHEGSIKELRNVLTTRGNDSSARLQKVHIPPLTTLHSMNEQFEEPSKDTDDIPDDQSEASSIVSNRTEYRELPTRSTLINGTGLSTGSEAFPLTDLSHDHLRATVSGINGLSSTPSKVSPTSRQLFPVRNSPFENTPKMDLSISSSALPDDAQGKVIPSTNQPFILHTPTLKSGVTPGVRKYSPSPSAGYSVGALNTKIQLLESQVSEWGDIIDEMSDRMANQPSLIRKFAKESISDKVGHRQHTEDLEVMERKLSKRIDDKFASLDRKIIELYDDLMSQVTNIPAPKAGEEKKAGRQDTPGKENSELGDSLTNQLEEQNEKLKHLSRGMSELDGKISHLKQDMTLYGRQMDAKRGDEELVSLVAEQLIGNEEITGWKIALKEIHAALNKQSEINTSVHHSYATLDKRTEAISQKIQLKGRWRWSGVSNLFPKAHSCVTADQQTDDISFTSQIHNTESRSLVWEKGKPYVVVTAGGCYWVSIGAFSKKTSTPPSLQVTIDEEPVSLFNSSGKSPSHHRISVISSASKYQPPTGRLKADGVTPWRPGSSLLGAVLIPAHSRISVSPTSTAPGTRMSVEGYLELMKMY
ncbi:uncharacterized protein [Montipora foliosa]|uniref:uncharacterized protein n=1 Tax=Montipora foliosa TaxID=591990 RepID=UPI0035F14C76